MTNSLIIASAGAGKSQMLIEKALSQSSDSRKVMLITYTKHNQKELLNKICNEVGVNPSHIIIKGWYSFLLEDMVRPYQRCIIESRISNINFNKKGDPHKKNARNIPGTAEKYDGKYNPYHYVTRSTNKVHTTYLSKLAARIFKETRGKTVKRLSEIYSTILIDEVQDLTGWDFEVIAALSKESNLSVSCVGDFRQTIYLTHKASKSPKTSREKVDKFNKLGFETKEISISRRCVQEVCDFSDIVHASDGIYPKTHSQVTEKPDKHLGVFAVPRNAIEDYIAIYKPVILRARKGIEDNICKGNGAYTFGDSKGLGFDRVLIIPTDKQRKFFSGEENVFDKDKTDESKNKLYVAITRARYSLAFMYDGCDLRDGVKFWYG